MKSSHLNITIDNKICKVFKIEGYKSNASTLFRCTNTS